MSWFNIFRIYNMKLLKKEKVLMILTAVSILFTICIALVIPQIQFWNGKYLEDNMYDINGGDLSIILRGKENDEFNNKINEFKEKGLEVNTSYYGNAAYINNANNNMGRMLFGEYNLKKNEIILSSIIAKNMDVNKGDEIEVNTKGNGTIPYIVKDIEYVAKAVDRDSELLGYGKVQANENIIDKSNNKIVYIKGKDGKELKEELFQIEEGNMYSTLDDKRIELKNKMLIESSVLGTLSSVSYILSSLCIITTTIMLILRRKKDISILRMLSINIKSIKKAMGFELSLVLAVPVLVGGLISYPISKMLLNYKGILDSYFTYDNLLIISKGILLNILILVVLVYISLTLIGKIKAIYIIKDDEQAIKKASKNTIKKIMVIIPIVLLSYALYANEIGNVISSIGVILFILVFMMLVSIFVKIISSFGSKTPMLLYTFKNIRENFFTFVLTLLSITITLWFILIGFYLEGTIKKNFNDNLKESLPYNYEILTDDVESIEDVLKSDENINNYNKIYYISAELTNKLRNPMYKNIGINEINKEDYNAKFNMVEGENLFEGEDGVIISDDMHERTDLKINDILNIKTENGDLNLRIKGFYKSGGVNTMAIYKEHKDVSKNVFYNISSESPDFIKKLKKCDIYNIDSMGDRLVENLMNFLNIFKVLSLVSIISVLLFNINVVNMSHSIEKKDEEILKALGVGKSFIIKSTVLKIVLTIILSSLLSLGLFKLIMSLFFSLMFNFQVSLTINTIMVLIIASIAVALISFNYIFKRNGKSLDLIRE